MRICSVIVLFGLVASFSVRAGSGVCEATLGPPYVLELPAPADLLRRPTRLQTLLETVAFRELPPSLRDSDVVRVLDQGRFGRNPTFIPDDDYFAFFTMDDIRLMAAHAKYAKKVAGDLRTYANLHLGGSTSSFRNEDVYRTARLLTDRQRLLDRGVPMLLIRADLEAEARHAGLKLQAQNDLSFTSGMMPETLLAEGLFGPRGLGSDSILGTFHRRRGSADDIGSARFVGLANTLGTILNYQTRSRAAPTPNASSRRRFGRKRRPTQTKIRCSTTGKTGRFVTTGSGRPRT